jgi:3-phenylpropionate/trans-cinnamate dioxygenase ferredoxin subunit
MPDHQRGQKQQWPIGQIDEIPPGERKIVEIKGRSIGVFNVNGQYVAVLNLCPHELAPVCMGRVAGTTLTSPPGEFKWGREGEILFCPWHGWEFDLLDGSCLTDKQRHLLKFPVTITDETIYITV